MTSSACKDEDAIGVYDSYDGYVSSLDGSGIASRQGTISNHPANQRRSMCVAGNSHATDDLSLSISQSILHTRKKSPQTHISFSRTLTRNTRPARYLSEQPPLTSLASSLMPPSLHVSHVVVSGFATPLPELQPKSAPQPQHSLSLHPVRKSCSPCCDFQASFCQKLRNPPVESEAGRASSPFPQVFAFDSSAVIVRTIVRVFSPAAAGPNNSSN